MTKKTGPSLEWCVVRLSDDENWWVDEISDKENWDTDDLGIIDTCVINDISEGTVIIFPFDYYHFVTPSNKKRITISYNIFSRIN